MTWVLAAYLTGITAWFLLGWGIAAVRSTRPGHRRRIHR